jgi:hypothetical protein
MLELFGKLWHTRLLKTNSPIKEGTHVFENIEELFNAGGINITFVIPESMLNELKLEKRKRDRYIYTHFDSIDEFCNFLKTIDEKDMYFHEVIFGKRKLFFDIDFKIGNFKPSPQELYNFAKQIETKIKSYYPQVPIKDEDFLWFSAHGKEKLSYHLILNNYYCENEMQNKEVANFLKRDVHNFLDLDLQVYIQIHNMRTLFSLKENGERRKIVCNEFRDTEPTLERDFDFKSSLITNIKDCVVLPSFHIKEWKTIYNEENINKIIAKVLHILKTDFEVCKRGHNSISFKCKDTSVPLVCPFCSTTHKEYGFNVVYEKDKATFFMRCWGNPSKAILLFEEKGLDISTRVFE